MWNLPVFGWKWKGTYFWDLTKVSGVVNHCLILSKIESLGKRGKSLRWAFPKLHRQRKLLKLIILTTQVAQEGFSSMKQLLPPVDDNGLFLGFCYFSYSSITSQRLLQLPSSQYVPFFRLYIAHSLPISIVLFWRLKLWRRVKLFISSLRIT